MCSTTYGAFAVRCFIAVIASSNSSESRMRSGMIRYGTTRPFSSKRISPYWISSWFDPSGGASVSASGPTSLLTRSLVPFEVHFSPFSIVFLEFLIEFHRFSSEIVPGFAKSLLSLLLGHEIARLFHVCPVHSFTQHWVVIVDLLIVLVTAVTVLRRDAVWHADVRVPCRAPRLDTAVRRCADARLPS